MRSPRILFIYPPVQLMPVETPRPDGSLGPLYLIGALRTIGIEANLLDASVGSPEDDLKDTFYNSVMQENGLIRIGMSWERIEQFLNKGQYDIVGINSNFTPQTKMAVEVTRIAKRVNRDTIVLAGGVNARALPQWFFKDGLTDLICTTEGEKIIIEIAQRFMGRKSLEGIPGTMFQRDGKIINIPPGPNTISINLDELPFPAWDKLPFDKYIAIDSPHGVDLTGKGHLYAPIMTGRGCPFGCWFCHISTEKGNIGDLRLKSVARVLEEFSMLKSLGVTKVFFEDDSLLAKKKRIIEILSNLTNRGLILAGVNGVNLVHTFKNVGGGKLEPDEDYLRLFAKAGFKQIVYPVESGSQRILNKYATGLAGNPKLNLETMDLENLVRLSVPLGIVCPINIMIGFPDETEEEIMASVEIAKRLVDAGAAYATFFIPIPFPGSRLYHIAIQEGFLPSDFDPDIFNWKRPVMRNTTVPPERLEELRDWAWNTVNTKEHVGKRIKESIGARRWNSNEP